MNVQQLMPPEPKPKRNSTIGIRLGIGIITVLAVLWRFISGAWSILILGIMVGVLGNAVFTALTTGKIDFTGTLTVIAWLNAHLALCLIILTPSLLLTLCSYLAHRWQRQRAQQTQHVHDEVLITKGVQRALDELKANPTIFPILTSAGNQEITVPKSIWNVPYRRNPFFTGRETLLTHLHDHLTTSKAAALTQAQAISGLGGIGKTQIALEYAYRYEDDYQAIFWVRAASRENVVTDFTEITRHLALPEKDEQDQNKVVAAVKGWLIANSNWLLILDNADEPEIVSDFLPPSSIGHILLTTRAQSIGSLAESIQVEKMALQEGIELLLRRARILKQGISLEQVSPQDQITAQQIVEAMDGLPLALDQAGAYIEEMGCRLADYLNLYTISRKELLKHTSKFASHPNVAITFSLAFQKVTQTNPVAADLLRFCAFLDPDAIPEELITEGSTALGTAPQTVAQNPLKFQETLGLLRNFSLIRRNADTATLAIHRLVQAVIKDEMDERTHHHWAERTVKAVSQVFPDVEVANWTQCERYVPHALMSIHLIEQYRMAFLGATELLFLVGKYFYQRSQLLEAEAIWKLDVEMTEKAQGANHPDTALSLNNLALLYHTQGKYEQAEPLIKRALAIFEKQVGPEHPDTATSLNNLAELYRAQGQYEQAEPLLQRALAICEKQVGPEHPDTARSLNNLAELYRAQGQYEQAEPLFQRALTIWEKQLGPEHPTTATSLNNLALLYHTQGKYEQAEPLIKRALAIFEKQVGPEHPDTARSLNNLALLYHTQGQYEQAEPLFQRALAIYEKQVGPEHPDTMTVRGNYTLFLVERKRKSIEEH